MRPLIAALLVSVVSMSNARADQALDKLLACRRLPDSSARLECFDRASDAALTSRQTEPAPSAPETPSKPAAVESSIARIAQPPTGPADFILDNGQVWRQMDAENARSAKVGDRVVITKAFLGAYWLRIDGGRSWRVTLIR